MALALGWVNVDNMLSSISSRQFDEWKAYCHLEPIGSIPTFLASAQIVAAVFNTRRKKGVAPIMPSKIMPDFMASAKRFLRRFGGRYKEHIQPVSEQIAIAEQLNMAFGGVDLRGKSQQER